MPELWFLLKVDFKLLESSVAKTHVWFGDFRVGLRAPTSPADFLGSFPPCPGMARLFGGML